MYHSLLVPLDTSPFAEHALPVALSIARRAKARLHLTVVHTPLALNYAEMLADAENAVDRHCRERERAYLENVVERLRKASAVSVTYSLLDGPIAEMIAAQGAKVGADLIVMTTHGCGPMGRFWLGSVADELVRKSTVPLLLLRTQEAKSDLGRDVAFRHVLIPLDGSELAEQIIEPAIGLGNLMEADYTLLEAIEPMAPVPLVDPAMFPLAPASAAVLDRLQQLHDQRLKGAHDYLNQMADKLRPKVPRLHTTVAIADQPTMAILNEIGPRAIDLVALATHGRGGIVRMALGSVADKVVRGTTVPILVTRPRSPHEERGPGKV